MTPEKSLKLLIEFLLWSYTGSPWGIICKYEFIMHTVNTIYDDVHANHGLLGEVVLFFFFTF